MKANIPPHLQEQLGRKINEILNTKTSAVDVAARLKEIEKQLTNPNQVTIEGWVARYANPHCLNLYKRKPDRLSDIWSSFDHNVLALDPTLFPSVTWKSEPLKVRLTITPIEE